jgi:predicted ATPase
MGDGVAEITTTIPELTDPELTGNSASYEPPVTADPEQARFKLLVAISDFLSNLAASQPLVIVLDDLQWADES